MKLVVLFTVALAALGCVTGRSIVPVKVTPGIEPDCHRGPLECRGRVVAGITRQEASAQPLKSHHLFEVDAVATPKVATLPPFEGPSDLRTALPLPRSGT